MRIKIDKLKELMDEKCGGNYNAFARETGLNVAAVYRIINGQANAGLTTINRIIDYLKSNNMAVEDYIFLP
jgi:predicted transcriptional regulator